MFKKFIAVASIMAFLACPAFAGEKPGSDGTVKLDEVTVTANRQETPLGQVGSSVTVITSKEIEQKGKSTVLEILRTVPGLDIVQTGGPGRITSVFMRGAKSEHTLVMVDGIEMNDPISAGRAYDFANLSTANVERIEVVRGPQSTLYGSDAMGGVINIITKKGRGAAKGYISAEGGSFDTYTTKAEAGGSLGGLSYSVGLSRISSGGISAASKSAGNYERDGFESGTVSTRLTYDASPVIGFDAIVRYQNTETDLDNSSGIWDDPNYSSASEQLFARTQARINLFDGRWTQKLGVSASNTDRKYDNQTDDSHPTSATFSTYNGDILKLDWQNDILLHETNTLTLGAESEDESGSSYYWSRSKTRRTTTIFEDKSVETKAFYLEDQQRLWDALFITLGARLDDNSLYGEETTYRAAVSYLLKPTGTRFKGSYGSGFKAPSLYQLYSQYGDAALKPEESIGWDAGFEQTFAGDMVVVGLTYFANDFDNIIEYDSTVSKYHNIAKAETSGFEFSTTIRPLPDLDFTIAYTALDAKDKATGLKLVRRADDKLSLDVSGRFLDKGGFAFGVVRVGEREDNDYSTWPTSRAVLPAYTLVNLALSWDANKSLTLFARGENLLNEEYEEIDGFGTTGFAAYAGAKVNF